MGWIGRSSQVLHFLGVVGADADPDGSFLIAGEPVVTFMGMGEEMVVPDGTVYFRNGQPCPLAAGLSQTSYGLKVNVV